jgi:hypothetical protein
MSDYDADGYDANGYDSEGLDRNGYDSEGYDCDGYDKNGWSYDGDLHRDTGTVFHPTTHLTREGDEYNDDGEDCYGNSRCDNGDCEDEDCELCNPPSNDDDFQDHLRCYSSRAPAVHGWQCKPPVLVAGRWQHDRTLYAGHEIEMYSDDICTSDVDTVLSQLNRAYRKFKPQTRTLDCAIAKQDGSLDHTTDVDGNEEEQGGGFEVVTVPLTREQNYGIFRSFDVLGRGSCSAWSMGTKVGHHIHLSRAAIGPLTLGKMLVFANAPGNQLFIEQVAGRGADFNAFCQKKLTDALKEYPNDERYEVLNVTEQTVEFRMFKANLKSAGILKNYEFAVSLVRYCEQSSLGAESGAVEDHYHPLAYHQYRQWLATRHAEYPYLHQFFLSHRSLSRSYKHGLAANAVPKDRSPKYHAVGNSAGV